MQILFLIFIVIAIWGEVQSIAPVGAISVFKKGEGGYYCHKIPYLFRTSSNTLIALAEGRGRDGRSSCDDFSGTDLVFKRSSDSGKTWSDLGVVFTNSSATESNVIGNAAPVQDRATGRIWLPFCKNNEVVYITHSDDDGATWSEPVYHPTLTQREWKWIGLGPPSGIQLSSGRMLIPSYHTNGWKGDGCVSRGHTIYSDDHGLTWHIGSADFGRPYLANECQAVELKNGSVLINARTLTNKRVQVLSNDGGLTFGPGYEVPSLVQPLEGCEGSMVRDPDSNTLYFSDPNARTIRRTNLTIFKSSDEGSSWQVHRVVDEGAVSYSALQVSEAGGLELLYERSDETKLVFEPLDMLYWKVV